MGDVIPGISEVLTFSGWLVFCISVCLPGCIYYSCPCAAARGCLVILHEQLFLPSAGSSRSAAAAPGLPLLSCLMSFLIIHPAPSLQRDPPPPIFNVCVGEVSRPKSFHCPFIPLLNAMNGSGLLMKFGGVPFLANGVAWPKRKICTAEQALILRASKHSLRGK